jgi:hypothetical protein
LPIAVGLIVFDGMILLVFDFSIIFRKAWNWESQQQYLGELEVCTALHNTNNKKSFRRSFN